MLRVCSLLNDAFVNCISASDRSAQSQWTGENYTYFSTLKDSVKQHAFLIQVFKGMGI